MKKNKLKWWIVAIITCVAFLVVLGVALIANTPEKRYYRRLDQGNQYLNELEYEKAIAEFQAAIKIDPNDDKAYLGLARAYVGLGDVDEAISAYKEAISLKTKDASAYLELAELYLEKGKTKEAEKILEKGVKNTKDDELLEKKNEISKDGDAKDGNAETEVAKESDAEGSEPEKSEPVEEEELPEPIMNMLDIPPGLEDFLVCFDCYSDPDHKDRYDCDGDYPYYANLIQEIIGPPSCVGEYPWSVGAWQEIEDAGQMDPLGKWGDKEDWTFRYRVSADFVDFTAIRIFHLDEAKLMQLREGEEYYYHEGYYYFLSGGIGWLDSTIVILGAWKKGERYYVKYASYLDAGDERYGYGEHLAEMGYEEILGSKYWTMYSHDMDWGFEAIINDGDF